MEDFALEDRVWLKRHGLRDPDMTVTDCFLIQALLEAMDIKENPDHALHKRYERNGLHDVFVHVAEDDIWSIRNSYRWPEMKAHIEDFRKALAPYRMKEIDVERFKIS